MQAAILFWARRLVAVCAFATAPALAQDTAPIPAPANPFPHTLADDASCPRVRMPALDVPILRQAMRSNAEMIIVALGSSSTQGWHSSDIAHSYPAILQAELQAALPSAHVAVINRGVGGQDAAEMVPRLAADALAIRPSLVIWQLGANGAMRRTDPEVFRDLVTAGVAALQAGKVDLVLMDNQRAPAVLAAPARAQFDQILSEAAARNGAGLFSRGTLMDLWQQAGHPYAQFVSSDGIHHNDHGYRCMAKALAASILDGLGITPAPFRSARR